MEHSQEQGQHLVCECGVLVGLLSIFGLSMDVTFELKPWENNQLAKGGWGREHFRGENNKQVQNPPNNEKKEKCGEQLVPR